jgi:hypothetical protein
MGRAALCAVTTGKENVGVGLRSGYSVSDARNTIAVGTSATTTNDNHHTVWGNSSNNVCNCVYTEWSNVSDSRDKTNIQTLPDNLGLRFIKKLRPVTFNKDHRETYVTTCGYEYGQKDGTLAGSKEHYGFVAQEIKETLDELNVKFDALGHDDNKDAYRLTYAELIASLTKAIQELDQRITDLEKDK